MGSGYPAHRTEPAVVPVCYRTGTTAGSAFRACSTLAAVALAACCTVAQAAKPDLAPPSLLSPATRPTDPAPGIGTLNLLQAWNKALVRDPIYSASQAFTSAEQEVVPQARARLLPYVQGNALGEIDDNRRVGTLGNGSSKSRSVWALTLSQPLFDLGAWRNYERAEFVAESATVAQTRAYQDLILRVAQAYFDILASQDTLRALLAEKSAIETQLRAAERGFELGSTTIADTYEAQSRLDLINAGELQLRNTLQINHDKLARIINERPAQLAELSPGTALPSPEPNRLDAWTTQASSANLAVAQASLSTRIVEKQIEIAKSERYPRIELQAQTGSASDRGLYTLGTGGAPRSLDTTVGVQLSIPLYTGGEISSLIREQTSRLQQARYELENAKRQAEQDTRQYFSGVTTGLAQIAVLQAAERSSLASVKANQTGYSVGVRVNIDVLNAQQQLFETQRNLAQARYTTLMNSLRLKAATGTLSERDIVAVNSLLENTEPAR
ncbi:MAG: TolC family outer membrane protein [Alcaligenaceae bacterium]|nr:TolC family outer membrane protein [Alcaligenaceae bacterium]